MTDESISAEGAVAPVADTTATAPETTPEPAEEVDPDLAALPDEKVRTGLQKRFKELTDKAKTVEQEKSEAIRKHYEAEARAQEYERRLQAMQKPVDDKEVGPMPEAPVLPSLDDPNIKTMDDFNRAIEAYKKAMGEYGQKLQEWSGKKSLAEYNQRQTLERQQRQQMEEAAKLRAKGEAAIRKYPDFVNTTQPLTPMANQIPELVQFVHESDTGTDVLYHLCKNPALLDSLARMTPVARNRELLRLEAAINAPPKRAQTKAPGPMKPVGAGDGNVTQLIDLASKDDVSEYIARSNREALRKRRGS